MPTPLFPKGNKIGPNGRKGVPVMPTKEDVLKHLWRLTKGNKATVAQVNAAKALLDALTSQEEATACVTKAVDQPAPAPPPWMLQAVEDSGMGDSKPH